MGTESVSSRKGGKEGGVLHRWLKGDKKGWRVPQEVAGGVAALPTCPVWSLVFCLHWSPLYPTLTVSASWTRLLS